MNEAELIRAEADAILRSRVLGRSKSYVRLFEFLVERSLAGRTPKELEIAVEVFDKGPDFDASQDSMVRVYAYNLRRKLERHYAEQGRDRPYQLRVARGEYRIVLHAIGDSADVPGVAVTSEPVPAPASRRPQPASLPIVATLLACCALLGLVTGWGMGGMDQAETGPVAESSYDEVAASPIWAPLLDDDVPLLIAVGDYYIFGELNGGGELGGGGEIGRLLRRFDVDSAAALHEALRFEPDSVRYVDLDLTYLPRGVAFALADVLRVLHASGKTARIVTMSDLRARDLKSNHVVYIGYISGLRGLEELVFSTSSLMVGMTYDELVDRKSGEVYASQAGIHDTRHHYRDYGLLSAFPGPNGNQFLIVAGVRDPGLMQMGQIVSKPHLVAGIGQDAGLDPTAPALEVLYEVMGLGRANLDAAPVHEGPLNHREIWGGMR